MGWTTACLIINEGPPGYFANFPLPSQSRARKILVDQLGEHYGQSKFSNLDRALSPPSGWFGFGAYDKGIILAGHKDLFGYVENPRGTLVSSLLRSFASGEALLFELTSSTGYFGFAFYVEGKLLRALAADPERGVIVDTSNLREPIQGLEEQAMANKNPASKGETVIFGLTQRFLGSPLDQFQGERLSIELIKKRPRILSWL